MGNRIRTRLIAVCLVATAMAVSSGFDRCAIEAAESSPRLVRIDMAAQPPLPRLVPITQLPISQAAPVAAAAVPHSLPGPASPPLVSISYAPALAAIKPLAIQAIPTPAYVPAPAVVYAPPAYTPPPAPAPPVYQSAALPVPLPVPVAPPLPVSLPPPLPVSATPSVSAYAPLPTYVPPPAYAPPPVTAYAAPVPTPAAPVNAPSAAPAAAPASGPAGSKPTDAITICSFNIQVFGESKISKPQVVDVLAKVVRKFDIVAVQEVRAKSDSVIPQFLSAINADGSRYQFVIGPRLGRTVSKEQYTFIYDSTRIEVDPSSVGTSPNPGDRLHRPPLHARFRVRANPPESGFSFWLVDTHTDPDEVSAEVNALADVFMEMKALRPDEDDVILMGDLNAGPPQFGKIKQIPGVGWAVSGVTTNTRRSKTYDNLIFDTRTTTEYTGRWGVLDLQNTFGLSIDKALEVSDHNPVWAAFRPLETQQVAGAAMPSGLTR